MPLNKPGIGDSVVLDGGWRSPSRARETWGAERRKDYLLREVDYPLSWDRRVFPPPADDVPQADDFELFAMILSDASSPQTLSGWHIGERLAELPPRPFEWELVGYDVCDEVGYSGLTNCAPYDVSERIRHARKWAPMLNSLHLFDELSCASDFRMEVNVLVPEHAPFLVHRVYAGPRPRPLAHRDSKRGGRP